MTTIAPELADAIQVAGFKPNLQKLRLQHRHVRQEVTGLAVNETPNVSRAFIRELDSVVQSWRKHGLAAARTSYLRHRGLDPTHSSSDLRQILRGKLGFLSMVKTPEDPVVRRLTWALHDLEPNFFAPPADLQHLKEMPLKGLSGRFQGWQAVVRECAEGVRFIEVITRDGDKRHASGFVLSPSMLATAGHVVEAGELRVYLDDSNFILPEKHFAINETRGRDLAILAFDGRPFEGCRCWPFQYRLPEIGEEVSALGFPHIPNRQPALVLHTGTVEALPLNYNGSARFIQTSFQSGGGLSGAPLIDRRGFVLGIMIESVFMNADSLSALPSGSEAGEHITPHESTNREAAPARPYGQAVPFEFLARYRRSCCT